jgi:DNA helicase-2/ATP-dependent DNA helicase PcrA
VAAPRFKPLRTAVQSAPAQSASSPSVAAGAGSGALREGVAILHERFGRGIVNRVEGSGENTKITVAFDNAGVKQLLMKFARFKIL